MKKYDYARFWALLALMPCADRDDLKEQLVMQHTGGRTASLRDMKAKEYEQMIRAMENATGRNDRRRPTDLAALKKKRSAVLHQMDILGIDTSDWEEVDRFCLQKRIAGKRFSKLDPEELSALLKRLKAILRK